MEKHVTVDLCYSRKPQELPLEMESLKVKSLGETELIDEIPQEWGGFASPWVEVLHKFKKLNCLYFKHMVVRDEDLQKIGALSTLQSLKLVGCYGFSTSGLESIARCSNLQVLSLRWSDFEQIDDTWFHILATTNHSLTEVDFYATDLSLKSEDIENMAKNCPLVSLMEHHDGGLVMLARTYRKLVKLVIMEHHDGDFEDFSVTQRGLIAIASGCLLLEHLSVNVDDITNGALECMGAHLSQLRYFRMVMLYRKRVKKLLDLPLDKGVTSLMMGCKELVRFDFYFGAGRSLSDAGLASIGNHGHNLRRVLLASIGSSDEGLRAFANGCPKLEKLIMKGENKQFSCRALAEVARKMGGSLKYVRFQGYFDSLEDTDLVVNLKVERYWNLDDVHVELIIPFDDELGLATPPASKTYEDLHGINERPSLRRNAKQLLAYRSLSTNFREDRYSLLTAFILPIWPPI